MISKGRERLMKNYKNSGQERRTRSWLSERVEIEMGGSKMLEIGEWTDLVDLIPELRFNDQVEMGLD